MTERGNKLEALHKQIKELEKKEQVMLDELQKTQNDQKSSYLELEKMVQVGSKYYQKCSQIKRAKQHEIPRTLVMKEAKAREL